MASKARIGIVVTLLLVSAACDEGGSSGVQTAGQAIESAQGGDAEILSRIGQITAWTDAGLFVYGGVDETRESVGGAALVAPRTGEITAVPEPFEFPIRRVGVAAPTESGVFLMGELCQRTIYEEDLAYCEPGGLVASSFSLADLRWQPVDLPDDLQAGPRDSWVVDLLGVTSSGSLILYLTTEGNREVGDAPFWSFQPETSEWTRFADPGIDYDDACLAGDQIVAVASEPSADGGTYSNTTLHSLPVNTPSASWRALTPLSDVTWGSFPLVSCGGTFAVVHGFTLDSPPDVAYSQSIEPSGMWVDLSPFSNFIVDYEIWTGDHLVLFDEAGAALTLDDGSWTLLDLPRGPLGSHAVWTGEEFVVIDPRSETGASVGEVGE